MSAPYHVTDVSIVSHGTLWLQFADGVAGEIDVSGSLRGPVFEIARSKDGFAEASIDPEGHTVCWPGGADLAPDVLHRAVRDRTDIPAAQESLGREMQARLEQIRAADAARSPADQASGPLNAVAAHVRQHRANAPQRQGERHRKPGRRPSRIPALGGGRSLGGANPQAATQTDPSSPAAPHAPRGSRHAARRDPIAPGGRPMRAQALDLLRP